MAVAKLMFEGQLLHLTCLLVLLAGVDALSVLPAVNTGEWLGVSASTWLWLVVFDAVVHQIYVWFCWRTELHSRLLSRIFGKHAFSVYAIGFTVVGGLRPFLAAGLAIANSGTLPLSPLLGYLIALLLAIPVAYLGYSVKRYFGFRRAFGIDHFETAYTIAPMVKQGIFRFTNNGMYVYGFLLIWIPVFVWQSAGALVAAVFSHLYIWVHYYATERPDMRRIYNS
jgi:hypothetical protein